jgi:hypothetical protein
MESISRHAPDLFALPPDDAPLRAQPAQAAGIPDPVDKANGHAAEGAKTEKPNG